MQWRGGRARRADDAASDATDGAKEWDDDRVLCECLVEACLRASDEVLSGHEAGRHRPL